MTVIQNIKNLSQHTGFLSQETPPGCKSQALPFEPACMEYGVSISQGTTAPGKCKGYTLKRDMTAFFLILTGSPYMTFVSHSFNSAVSTLCTDTLTLNNL